MPATPRAPWAPLLGTPGTLAGPPGVPAEKAVSTWSFRLWAPRAPSFSIKGKKSRRRGGEMYPCRHTARPGCPGCPAGRKAILLLAFRWAPLSKFEGDRAGETLTYQGNRGGRLCFAARRSMDWRGWDDQARSRPPPTPSSQTETAPAAPLSSISRRSRRPSLMK
jgi:hypothetical protein